MEYMKIQSPGQLKYLFGAAPSFLRRYLLNLAVKLPPKGSTEAIGNRAHCLRLSEQAAR
jgi:hypothetical protein